MLPLHPLEPSEESAAFRPVLKEAVTFVLKVTAAGLLYRSPLNGDLDGWRERSLFSSSRARVASWRSFIDSKDSMIALYSKDFSSRSGSSSLQSKLSSSSSLFRVRLLRFP